MRLPPPTLDEIEDAVYELRNKITKPRHEHTDCILAAWHFLDAQNSADTAEVHHYNIKHVAEHWFGRFITSDDVIVAAHLHPDVYYDLDEGLYISSQLVLPDIDRVKHLSQYRLHKSIRNTIQYQRDHFTYIEDLSKNLNIVYEPIEGLPKNILVEAQAHYPDLVIR